MKIGQIISGILLILAGILFGISYKNNTTETSQKQETVEKVYDVASLKENEKNTIDLFDKCVNSVAFITTSTIEKSYWTRDISEIPRGSGSGFIWDEEGHIVTNFHVIQGADRATVTLYDQSTYSASLVGAAPEKDLAVLKIDAPDEKLIPINKGKSESLRVGQSALAIGNPFGLDYTLTEGIISALGREINAANNIKIKDVIQTDAAINPGNSGGPLINSSGELIGVNTAIYSPSGAYAGIGFSIPVDAVKWVVADLIKYGKVKRAVLGIELVQNARVLERYNLKGALIMNVIKNKGADEAGLVGTRRDRKGQLYFGDLITGINGMKIENNSDLVLALEEYEAGDEVDVEYLRNGKREKTSVTLGEN
jgi:S1-C subfamily serine protease